MRIIIFAVLSVLIFASGSFAAGNGATHTSTGSLFIGGSTDSEDNVAPDLLIGLSPKVVGHYLTDGDAVTTAQWYAIGTVHPGGNIAYGTSQDVNNVYMIWFETGSDPNTAVQNVPQEKNEAPGADGELGGGWTGRDWSLTPPTEAPSGS